MVFALVDYLLYRSRLGKYHPRAIEGSGGILATRENFPANANLWPGDVLIMHTCRSFLSWCVMYYTSSVWSHTALYAGDDRLVDATTAGVLEHPFADYLDGNAYIVVRRPKGATPEEGPQVVNAARKFLGRPFGWHKVYAIWLRTMLGGELYRLKFTGDLLAVSVPLLVVLYLAHGYLFWFAVACHLLFLSLVGFNVIRTHLTRRKQAKEEVA